MKKYNYKDNFEMVYLRHEYLARCEKLNTAYIDEFAGIVNTTAQIMYKKFFKNFNTMGFAIEDVVSVTNMYMLYYMELYSLREHDEKEKKYIKKYLTKYKKVPTPGVIKNYDRNCLIQFLRQRIQHFSTLCYRKYKDNVVWIDGNIANAEGEDFLENFANTLSDSEYLDAMVDRNSAYASTPEELIINQETEVEIEQYKEKFKNMSRSAQRRRLKDFIENNKHKKGLRKEMALARKVMTKGYEVLNEL